MIRTIIVDDEPLARQLIKEYLEDYPEISVITECKNGKQAVKAINKEKPSLVFLDIRMPDMDGFEVIERLTFIPEIIFSTAFNDYALKAFEVNAVDYLLKPYNRMRFKKAIENILHREKKSSQQVNHILKLLSDVHEPSQFPKRIFIRVGKKIVGVQTGEIIWIEANGDYTNLHTEQHSYLSNLSLNELEARLDQKQFVRVHRSFMIAANAIEHLASDGEGGYIATLKDRSKVKVSRTYAPKLKHLFW